MCEYTRPEQTSYFLNSIRPLPMVFTSTSISAIKMETPLLITPTYTRRLLIIPATHPRLKGTTSNPNDELKIALHDYRITESRPDALTLLFTHGTSFNKDLWHMLIDELLSDKEVARDVKRVVAIDAVTHGDSAVANAGKLGEKSAYSSCGPASCGHVSICRSPSKPCEYLFSNIHHPHSFLARHSIRHSHRNSKSLDYWAIDWHRAFLRWRNTVCILLALPAYFGCLSS
jgi:hypothetical protein